MGNMCSCGKPKDEDSDTSSNSKISEDGVSCEQVSVSDRSSSAISSQSSNSGKPSK